MSQNSSSKRTIIVVAAVILLLIVVAVVFVAFFANQAPNPTQNPTATPQSSSTPNSSINISIPTSPIPSFSELPAAGYWTLNVTASGGGTITPNGIIQVSTTQNGISITAQPIGSNNFIYWIFDGIQSIGDTTIFVPTQADNSTHTLEAVFGIGP
jgi:hypothetical protein